MNIRSRLNVAVGEQKRLAQIAAQAEGLASEIRQGAQAHRVGGERGAEEEETSRQMAQLVEQLASARTRASQTEQQLSSSYAQLGQLERLANEVPRLRSRLEAESQALERSAAEVVRLGEENSMQRRRMEQLESLPPPTPPPAPVVKKLAQVEAENKELAAQVELLKSQLLVAVATPRTDVEAALPPTAATQPLTAPARWAMRTSYDAAAEFLRLHFDRETFRNLATADGAVVSSAAKPANAATMRIVHDEKRERVYSGVLTVSLAADGPRERVAENERMVGEFLQAFAPSAEKPERLAAEALARVRDAGKAGAERWVVVGADFKLTAWQMEEGRYVFRCESPRVDFGV
jgi:hypothetical protein